MSLALLADLALLLAEVFLEPDADRSEGLEQLGGCSSHGFAGPLGRMLAHPMGPEEQSVEYARLFLQAKDTDVVHLFESVQARGHLLAPEVLEPLRAIYDAADLSLQEGLGLPPDHLGLELACLNYLLVQVIEGDPEERALFVALAQRLVREHLRPFTAAVAEQTAQVRAHAYYQAASDLALALLPEVEKALAEI